MTAPICVLLCEYARTAKLRLHMPGHGGRVQCGENSAEEALNSVFPFDVTELDKTDNLYRPEDAIMRSEKLASEMFSSGETLFSCGGATLALQTAICAAAALAPEGKRVLCDRRCHKSVANAFALLGIEPEWTVGVPNEGELSEAGVYIFTACDYYGKIAELAEISEACASHGVLTVADNSHGSHLCFIEGGQKHPLYYNVDFTVDSLHKTLPVLTGGALLHISKPLASREDGLAEAVREKMSVFGSTSPSFIILASIDAALAKIRDNMCPKGERTLVRSVGAVQNLRREFSSLFLPSDDPLRLYLGCKNSAEVYKRLSDKGAVCEFYDSDGIIMIPPYGFDENDAHTLDKAIRAAKPEPKSKTEREILLAERAMNIREAVFAPHERIPLKKAAGRISGAMYAVYPPGIPAIVAGERFDEAVIAALSGSESTVTVVKNK